MKTTTRRDFVRNLAVPLTAAPFIIPSRAWSNPPGNPVAKDLNSAQALGATGQERLAISFWNFGLLSNGPDSIFNSLEKRMEETVARGFNCIRTEGGAGITHLVRPSQLAEAEQYTVFK